MTTTKTRKRIEPIVPIKDTLFHSSRMECCGQLVTGRSAGSIVQAMEDHLRGAGAGKIACTGLPVVRQ